MITSVGEACQWLEKEPPRSITTWEDLVSNFINEFFPSPSRTTNLRGNLLERSTQDVLTIIENKSKQTSSVTTAMTAMLKQFQATPPPAPVKAVEEIYVTCGGSGSLPSNTVANPKGELKAITTHSGLVIDGPTVPTPSQSINPEVYERVEETFTDPDLADITLADALILMPKYQKMLKALMSNKEKLQELENTPLNKIAQRELKCKALADLGANINLMPLFIWKKLGLPELIPTCMTLEQANHAICTHAGIARDDFIPVGKFTFLADFVIVDYESDPRVPLILGRHFLWIARALIDVHGEEMILRDEVCNVLSEKLPDLDSTKDLHPFFDDNPLSGSTTYFSTSLLEEFIDELALITCHPKYDDNLQFDIESDLKEMEFMLYQDKDSSLKDLIDQKDLANLDDIFVNSIPKMFTDEHTLDYSYPSIFDVYDDDFLEVEFDDGNVYDDPFDSKEEKIKESKLLIDELDLPCDFLPPSEYDSFIS
nr:reverse transcriptase domain-containing protein [Tanacetum cinerariifolium]